MADLPWCLVAGVGLMVGIVGSGLSIWAGTRTTFPILVMLWSAAGFGLALWAGEHLHG